MTHTTIWELNLINKKETNVKYNHRQMTHTTICESTVKLKKKHIKSDHCQMTHTTIWELKLINKKETNIK